MSALSLPQLPVPIKELARHIAEHPDTSIVDIVEPYRKFETDLRKLYAQDAENEALLDPDINITPLFGNENSEITIRAREIANEPQEEKNRYIMALPEHGQRRPHGSPAVVKSLKEFQNNFNVFSEASLVDLDWSNVVASGSSVVNCLLPVPEGFNSTKRKLREFYHEKFCPASDVDLFLYGLTEEGAIEKIRQIEAAVRDAILTETTVVRTKHAITICSQYPTRHVQIVLRIYKNISEILTGFDIDCSAAAYDGKQVYCTPRALQSYITQINHIDLSRRSPSYENRLSKYSHRGFEVYWPDLDRKRIDPTIFERSFLRTLGLARLLVLERLPTSSAREQYLAKRRQERGRPPLNRRPIFRMGGNIKDNHEDEVADWVDEQEASNYHTFTIPYGEKFHAKKIEKLCYTKDLLLNAEWNQPEHRAVYLHRHPAFFGRFDDVLNDCCGFCPTPETTEEKEVHEQESKIYVSGKVEFMKDDPGRQQIGSFNPLTEDDWTEMAYVGNTARLCLDIVDGNLEHVQDWLSQDGADANTRDYTGRTPLHLAIMSSTPEIVKCLVDHGARLVARLADGRTALHLAAERGDCEIVKILMDKSATNEAKEEEKQIQRQGVPSVQPAKPLVENQDSEGEDSEDSDIDVVDDGDSDDASVGSVATGSFVKLGKDGGSTCDGAVPEENDDDPDVFDVNVCSWDVQSSALHLAITLGHEEVVKLLCQEYGADVLLPVKFLDPNNSEPIGALLTLVLAVKLPLEKAKSMTKTLLGLGASIAQADLHGITAFQRLVEGSASELISLLLELDKVGVKSSINHIAIQSYHETIWPLETALEAGNVGLVLQLLQAGAVSQIDFETWLKVAKTSCFESRLRGSVEDRIKVFETTIEQPIILAIRSLDPSSVFELIKCGADVNAMPSGSKRILHHGNIGQKGETVLDLTRDQIRRLREWKPPVACIPTLKTTGLEEALAEFHEGTWQRAVAMTQVSRTKRQNEKKVANFESETARLASPEPGMQMKEEAIESAIAVLEKIEKEIIGRGGKTFEELHPNAPDLSRRQLFGGQQGTKESPDFKLDFSFFNVIDLTEKRRAKYIELFEAAWTGNLEKIKALTLATWDDDEPPLQIAVHDRDANPFWLAYWQGHHEVAKSVLQIAQAQYCPEERPKARYRMRKGEDAEESDDEGSDDDEPQIYQEIVDEQFTVEDIGKVSMQVKSKIQPLDMLGWKMAPFEYKDGKFEGFSDSRRCFLRQVIDKNDRDGLRYYYDLTVHFAGQHKDEDEGNNQLVIFPQWSFLQAVKNGRIELITDMIKLAGAGLPLAQLVKKTGVELVTKPRFYQGLTVYGKKRKDWAAKGRNVVSRPTDNGNSPLIHAAQRGSLESVEWFLSDAPLRHYLEFGKSEAAEKLDSISHLNRAGGFDRAVTTWLGSQNDLVIHAAIMGPNHTRVERLVRYLAKVYPSSLEAKDVSGMTPLCVATSLGRLNLIKILIEHGADQSVKDSNWNNLVHIALSTGPKAPQLRAFLELLDPELRYHLLKERNSLRTSDGRTPLHQLVGSHTFSGFNGTLQEHSEQLLVLLEYSKGEELDYLDGTGDTPLHTLLIRGKHPRLARQVLELNPQLLYRENAVGQTPAELAHSMYVQACMTCPPRSGHRYGDTSIAGELIRRTPEVFAVQAQIRTKRSEAGSEQVSRGGPNERLLRAQQKYNLANEFAARFPGKRRLVSLHEANDVARRIGETYQGQRYGWNTAEGPKLCETADRREVRLQSAGEEDGTGDEVGWGGFFMTGRDTLRASAWEEPVKSE